MRPVHGLFTTVLILLILTLGASPGGAAPEGQLTWAVHFSLAPTLFEPAETPGLITPFMILYALHDALVKPMPGKSMAPSLAESWTMSPDRLVYDFVLRKGARFHTGDPVTAEDVKFSFERYRGIFARAVKERVATVETNSGHVRFRLKQPWPDCCSRCTRPRGTSRRCLRICQCPSAKTISASTNTLSRTRFRAKSVSTICHCSCRLPPHGLRGVWRFLS